MPNKIESIISFLACAKNGIIWSSCSPDFGTQGVVDRFKQIEPSILITSDHYFYNGKRINILEKVEDILKQIPSIKKTLAFSYNENEKHDFKDYVNFDEVLNQSKLDETFERFEFNHPIYILYSSGTTGKPKCITHGAGNVLIEHNKDANNWLCPSWCCNPSPANVVLPAVAPIKNPLAWESPAAHARSPTL